MSIGEGISNFAELLKRVPLLRLMQEPVMSVPELYARHPKGGELGWFSWVENEKRFYYWDTETKAWHASSSTGVADGLASASWVTGLKSIIDGRIEELGTDVGELTTKIDELGNDIGVTEDAIKPLNEWYKNFFSRYGDVLDWVNGSIAVSVGAKDRLTNLEGVVTNVNELVAKIDELLYGEEDGEFQRYDEPPFRNSIIGNIENLHANVDKIDKRIGLIGANSDNELMQRIDALPDLVKGEKGIYIAMGDNGYVAMVRKSISGNNILVTLFGAGETYQRFYNIRNGVAQSNEEWTEVVECIDVNVYRVLEAFAKNEINLQFNKENSELSIDTGSGGKRIGSVVLGLPQPLSNAPAVVRNNITEVRRIIDDTQTMPSWMVDSTYSFADMGTTPFFRDQTRLIQAGDVVIRKPTRIDYMSIFSGCSNLASIGKVIFDIGTHFNAVEAFKDCALLPFIDLMVTPSGASLVPYRNEPASPIMAGSMFEGCSNLIVVSLNGIAGIRSPRQDGVSFINRSTKVFKGCSSLVSIKGCIDLEFNEDNTEMFTSCAELVDVRILNLSQSISFADSPKLSLESILYLFNNAIDCRGAQFKPTITLHQDAFQRIPSGVMTAQNKGFNVVSVG